MRRGRATSQFGLNKEPLPLEVSIRILPQEASLRPPKSRRRPTPAVMRRAGCKDRGQHSPGLCQTWVGSSRKHTRPAFGPLSAFIKRHVIFTGDQRSLIQVQFPESRSGLTFQAIANTLFREDQGWTLGINFDLLAQTRDINPQVGNVGGRPPGLFQDIAMCEHLARMRNQQP